MRGLFWLDTDLGSVSAAGVQLSRFSLSKAAEWLSRGGQDGFSRALADPRRYATQIDRLHHKHLFDGAMYRMRQDGVSLASVVLHRDAVARRLAGAVAAGDYQLHPATIRLIRI